MGQKLNVLNQYIDTELVMTEKSDDKISEYNVNEYFVPSTKKYDFIFNPKYAGEAKKLAKSVYRIETLDVCPKHQYHVSLSAFINCYELHNVFGYNFDINRDKNIHTYSIKKFQSYCKQQGMEFSGVYWDHDELTFCWETKAPVKIKSRKEFISIFQSFLDFLDCLGIEELSYCADYSYIERADIQEFKWDKKQFATYGCKRHHEERELTNSAYGLLQEDGSMKCYDINGNPITYDEACDFD
ncbi:hypothetical protein [Turicibacter sanguinis]|uniref:hypothetical protein n=1 Tax=Turicibacter sanguinis TaxID=154288 RepID=UPI002941E1DC|nr:hypothetical protein [Turicibacter sanguinis]